MDVIFKKQKARKFRNLNFLAFLGIYVTAGLLDMPKPPASSAKAATAKAGAKFFLLLLGFRLVAKTSEYKPDLSALARYCEVNRVYMYSCISVHTANRCR